MRCVSEFNTFFLFFSFFKERDFFLQAVGMVSTAIGPQYKTATSLQGTCKRNSLHYTASTGCVRETASIKKLAWKCKRNSPHKAASMGCVREIAHTKRPAWDV